jgi:hypothetical protein
LIPGVAATSSNPFLFLDFTEEPMNDFHSHADPPRTLGERLAELNDNLHSLSVRLKDAIAHTVSTAVGDAIRDALRNILGRSDSTPRDQGFHQTIGQDPSLWEDSESPRWHDEEDLFPRHQDRHHQRKKTSTRWGNALGMALQTGLWWMRQQPRRRPVLTTTVVAVAAGVTAFLAGPTLAAGVGVLASAASLFMTASTAKTAGEQLQSLVTD